MLKLPFVAVVYDIKCVIDDILDTVENIGDAALNDLKPIFEALRLEFLRR